MRKFVNYEINNKLWTPITFNNYSLKNNKFIT